MILVVLCVSLPTMEKIAHNDAMPRDITMVIDGGRGPGDVL